MDAHRMEDVFPFPDINGLLQRENKLRIEEKENGAGRDRSCCRPNDGGGTYDVGLGMACF